MKASDTDGEVNETMKKKHVTMDGRTSSRSSPKMTSSNAVTDIRNRYYKKFSLYHPDKYLMINSHSYVN